MNKFIIIILLIFKSIFLFAQYEVEWARGVGGDGWDEANTVIETHDGNYVVAGFVKRMEKHMWLVKLKKDGLGIWGKTFSDYFECVPNSITQTKEKELVITGYIIKKNSLQSDMWVIKTDSMGNKIWEKTFGDYGNESGECIITTRDGGFAIAGHTSSNNENYPDFWVVRLDANGNKIWDKAYGGRKDDKAFSICQTPDGGFAACGYTSTAGGTFRAFWVIKLDSLGNDVWGQTIKQNEYSGASAIISTHDSCLVAVGYTRTYAIIDYDAMVIKFDKEGNELWRKIWGNAEWDEATSIVETYDHSIAVGGFSKSRKEMKGSFLVLKYDKSGNLIWNTLFKRKSLDYAKSIVETRDNGLVLAGATFSQGSAWDFAVMKFRNQSKSTFKFINPADSISTVMTTEIDFEACVQTFSNLKNVRIEVNDTIQVGDVIKDTKINLEGDCNYPMKIKLYIRKGFNKILVRARDYKDHEFKNQRIIYSVPRHKLYW